MTGEFLRSALQNLKACYWCQGTGLMQSNEECPCTTNSCKCRYCKEC